MKGNPLKPRRWVACSLALCFFLLCALQMPGFRLLRSFPMEVKYLQSDRLGNLFVVNKTNQLYKYNAEGRQVSTLNYKYLGNITHVDPTNPLEVYVFYRELNTVLFLDNNLAYRGELNLGDVNIGQASAIARSYDNGLWVFDLADLQLKKLNKTGETLQASGNVRQFVTSRVAPSYIYDDNNRVYMNDSANGILVFDVFASYVKTIPIRGCRDFKIIDNNLFYTTGKYLIRYDLGSSLTSTFAFPDTTAQVNGVSVEKERLYLARPDSIDIYSFR